MGLLEPGSMMGRAASMRGRGLNILRFTSSSCRLPAAAAGEKWFGLLGLARRDREAWRVGWGSWSPAP